jgi:hypothetical protein
MRYLTFWPAGAVLEQNVQGALLEQIVQGALLEQIVLQNHPAGDREHPPGIPGCKGRDHGSPPLCREKTGTAISFE